MGRVFSIWANSASPSTKMLQLVKKELLVPSRGAYMIDFNLALLDFESSDIAAVRFEGSKTKNKILKGFWIPRT